MCNICEVVLQRYVTTFSLLALTAKGTFSKNDGDRWQWLPETTNDFRKYSTHDRVVCSWSSTPRQHEIVDFGIVGKREYFISNILQIVPLY